MAHNLVMENVAVNAGCDAECALANGGYLRIYEGAVKLAELRFGNPAFSGAIAGVATAAAITPESSAPAAAVVGADSYQVYKSDGATLCWAGTVGVTGGGFDLELDDPKIQLGAQVSVTSFTHTRPKHP